MAFVDALFAEVTTVEGVSMQSEPMKMSSLLEAIDL